MKAGSMKAAILQRFPSLRCEDETHEQSSFYMSASYCPVVRFPFPFTAEKRA